MASGERREVCGWLGLVGGRRGGGRARPSRLRTAVVGVRPDRRFARAARTRRGGGARVGLRIRSWHPRSSPIPCRWPPPAPGWVPWLRSGPIGARDLVWLVASGVVVRVRTRVRGASRDLDRGGTPGAAAGIGHLDGDGVGPGARTRVRRRRRSSCRRRRSSSSRSATTAGTVAPFASRTVAANFTFVAVALSESVVRGGVDRERRAALIHAIAIGSPARSPASRAFLSARPSTGGCRCSDSPSRRRRSPAARLASCHPGWIGELRSALNGSSRPRDAGLLTTWTFVTSVRGTCRPHVSTVDSVQVELW